MMIGTAMLVGFDEEVSAPGEAIADRDPEESPDVVAGPEGEDRDG